MERMTTNTIIEMVNKYATGKKYLEIGVYRGGLISEIKASFAVGIDNFSEFNRKGDNKKAVLEKIEGKPIELIDGDCYNAKTYSKAMYLAPFDVFMYDGDHGTQETTLGIIIYHYIMADEYILIVDDWNSPKVRNGTMQALKYMESQLLEEHFTAKNASPDYWNGIAVFKVTK